MSTKKFILGFICAAVVIMLSMNSCKDAVTPLTHTVDFSAVATDDSVGDVGILTLEWVKILVKDIKFNITGTSTETNFKTGSFYIFFNTFSNQNSVFLVTSAAVTPATYDKVKFEIHKLENNEPVPDPDFADSLGRYSVVVRGRYAGTPFVYKSTKSAHQILTFPGPMLMDAAGKSNITMVVKPYIWFIKNGAYLDPNDPNNRNDIDNNIKDNINHNFKAFKDDDKNGIPDWKIGVIMI